MPAPVTPIAARYAQLGGVRSFLGAPVGTEHAAGGGREQDYQHGAIFWSTATGAHEVHGEILAHYRQQGGPAGLLGLPTTDETRAPDGVGRYNHFAGSGGGSVYWSPKTGARSLVGAVRSRWASLGWERGRLGYPTTDEHVVANGLRSDFQHGWILLRGGVAVVTYRG